MKRFLLFSLVFFLGAIVATIVVWYMIVVKADHTMLPTPSVRESQREVFDAENDSFGDPDPAYNPQPLITEPIPLRDLPLSEAQLQIADTAGIDVDTFVITPAMYQCAADKLGATRMNEIISGSSPSFMESVNLMSCL